MKVYLSAAKRIKEHFPNFRDWESAMIERFGDGITSKTNEIWNLILEKEKKIIGDYQFKEDAISKRKIFNDFYKWQESLTKKYGIGIQKYLYSVWIDTKNAMLVDDPKFKQDAENLRIQLNDFDKWQVALIQKYGSDIQSHLHSIWIEIDKTQINYEEENNINNSKENEYISDEEKVLLKSLFWLKIISIILLSLSLLKLPIGYYSFLRIIVCGISGFSAYTYYTGNRTVWLWLFGFIALLFNPIIPLYFGKSVWSVIDLLTALVFVISIFVLKEFPYRAKKI